MLREAGVGPTGAPELTSGDRSLALREAGVGLTGAPEIRPGDRSLALREAGADTMAPAGSKVDNRALVRREADVEPTGAPGDRPTGAPANKKPKKASQRRNVITSYLFAVTLAAVGFLTTPVLTHGLGILRYGVWALIGSLILRCR